MWDRTFNYLLDNVTTAGRSLPVSADPSVVSRQDRSINITQHHVFKNPSAITLTQSSCAISSFIKFRGLCVFSAYLGMLEFSLLFDQENNCLHCTIQKARVRIILISLSHQHNDFIASLPLNDQQKDYSSFLFTGDIRLLPAIFSSMLVTQPRLLVTPG